MKKVLLSLLVLAVISGDCLSVLAEIANLKPQPFIRYKETDTVSTMQFAIPAADCRIDLPLPKLLFYFFYAGGVFNAVSTFNLDYAFYARPRGADPNLPWVDLGNVRQCFPYPLGEIFLRLDMAWPKLLGEASYREAMAHLAGKIREKYNREHPDRPVEKVAIYWYWRPRSENGYTSLLTAASTHWQLLYAEK